MGAMPSKIEATINGRMANHLEYSGISSAHCSAEAAPLFMEIANHRLRFDCFEFADCNCDCHQRTLFPSLVRYPLKVIL